MKLPDTFDLLQKFERCTSEDEVTRVTLDAAAEYGVEHYLSGTMPHPGSSPSEQMNHIIGGYWPEGWARRYFQKNYIDRDPTIDHVRNSSAVLVWNGIQPSSKDEKKVMHEAGDFGLIEGITVPQHSLDGLKIGISFAGRHMDTSNPFAKTALTVIGSYAVATTMRARRRNQGEKLVALTPREREVLYWIAEGKTGHEIGVILTLANATVEKHFRGLMSKLGAQNRAHAVAEAIRRGIIH
ncbi:MAG: LuxR family transcriptional regulator [Pseudomonadota bacterium]